MACLQFKFQVKQTTGTCWTWNACPVRKGSVSLCQLQHQSMCLPVHHWRIVCLHIQWHTTASIFRSQCIPHDGDRLHGRLIILQPGQGSWDSPSMKFSKFCSLMSQMACHKLATLGYIGGLFLRSIKLHSHPQFSPEPKMNSLPGYVFETQVLTRSMTETLQNSLYLVQWLIRANKHTCHFEHPTSFPPQSPQYPYSKQLQLSRLQWNGHLTFFAKEFLNESRTLKLECNTEYRHRHRWFI